MRAGIYLGAQTELSAYILANARCPQQKVAGDTHTEPQIFT